MTAFNAEMAGSTKGDEVRGVVLSFLVTRKGFNVMANQISLAVRRAAVFVFALVAVPLTYLQAYFGPAGTTKITSFTVFPCPMIRATTSFAIAGLKPQLAHLLSSFFSLLRVFVSLDLKALHCEIVRASWTHSFFGFFSNRSSDLRLRIHPSIFVRYIPEALKFSLLAILEHFFCTPTLARSFLIKAVITHNSVARRFWKKLSTNYAGSLAVGGLGNIPSWRHNPKFITMEA